MTARLRLVLAVETNPTNECSALLQSVRSAQCVTAFGYASSSLAAGGSNCCSVNRDRAVVAH